MAEKKQHKIVSASTGEQVTSKPAGGKKPVVHEAAPVGNASGLRIGAVVLWVVAIIFEVLALLVVLGKINLHFLPTLETVRLQVNGREWIDVELGESYINLTIAKNTTDEVRKGTVTCRAGEDVRSFNIVQASASGSGGGGSDDPGDEPGEFVATYEDWVGTWTVGGRTLSFAESEDYPGEVLVMTDSGYGELANYLHPNVVFDEESGKIVFCAQKLYEHNIEQYYFLGVNGQDLLFGDSEYHIVAEGSMTSAGKAQIVPVSFTDTQGTPHSASGLTLALYQTEDDEVYEKGWYGLQGVEELAIPANISKAGTSSVSSVKTTGSQLPVFKRSFVRFNR